MRPTPEQVADWLQRTLEEPNVRFERTSETVLAFRSQFALGTSGILNPSLSTLAGGEIEVQAGPDGPIIAIRANPRAWYGLIPVVQLIILAGWTSATEALRWGAGLGGLILSAMLLVFSWGDLNYFLSSTAALLSNRRTRLPPSSGPPGQGRLTSA